MDILVEVNVSGEESKSGITPAEAEDFIREVSKFEHIRVKGLMTMAPFDAKDEELHQIFSNIYCKVAGFVIQLCGSSSAGQFHRPRIPRQLLYF